MFYCNEDVVLYHGTLRTLVEAIIRDGLQPGIGPFTTSHYGLSEEDRSDLRPVVFAADRNELRSCVSAMGDAINRVHGIEREAAFQTGAIHKYGALIVIEGQTAQFQQRPEDPDSSEGRAWDARPDISAYRHVEWGNYCSDKAVYASRLLVGDELIDFLVQHEAL